MVCNISRIKGLAQCRQKEYNREIRRLAPLREAEPLMTGGSYHEGIAHFFATNKKDEAVAKAEGYYRERLATQQFLEAEIPALEREIFIAKTAVAKYADYYPKEDFQVLMPEVSFLIPMPNSLHHCWYAHKILYPNIPYEECDGNAKCWIHHYFRGRADALLSWRSMIWILEQKTSGLQTENWWRQWLLDVQLSGYTYGTWKATGIKPSGVLLNKIRKPKKNESLDSWIQDPNIFTREPFLRSNDDLARFEKEFTLQCQEYEDTMRLQKIWLNTDACFDWNRSCYYHKNCIDHQEVHEGQFIERPNDYVEDAYYELLNIPNPHPKAEELEPNGVD